MSLKDDIEMVLEDAYWIGSDAAKNKREAEPSMLIARGYADRILALIAEALLSSQAVAAGAAEIDSMRPYNVMDDARFVIEAALAAAGLTNDPA